MKQTFLIVLMLVTFSFAGQAQKPSDRIKQPQEPGDAQFVPDDPVTQPTPTPTPSSPAVTPQPSALAFAPPMLFDSAIRHEHSATLLYLEGNFVERNLIGNVESPFNGFLGNQITVDDGQHLIRLWIDFASFNQTQALMFVSVAPALKKLRVIFDPQCGLVTRVEIVGTSISLEGAQ